MIIFFSATPIILFLNKSDLFEKKITKVPLERFFTDYDGGEDFEKAKQYLQSKFKTCVKNVNNYYLHITCATNTENIEFVFKSVQHIFISGTLSESGFQM